MNNMETVANCFLN